MRQTWPRNAPHSPKGVCVPMAPARRKSLLPHAFALVYVQTRQFPNAEVTLSRTHPASTRCYAYYIHAQHILYRLFTWQSQLPHTATLSAIWSPEHPPLHEASFARKPSPRPRKDSGVTCSCSAVRRADQSYATCLMFCIASRQVGPVDASS